MDAEAEIKEAIVSIVEWDREKWEKQIAINVSFQESIQHFYATIERLWITIGVLSLIIAVLWIAILAK